MRARIPGRDGTLSDVTRVILPLGVALLVMAGAAVFAYRSFGRQAGEDVGGLAAMRPVQAGLAQLPACGVEYRNHQRSPRDKVMLRTCEDDPLTAWVAVPKGWTLSSGFNAKRERVGAPWQIFIEKDKVSLDALVAALTALTPVVTTEGVEELETARKSRDDYRNGSAARARAAEEEAAKNRASYEK